MSSLSSSNTLVASPRRVPYAPGNQSGINALLPIDPWRSTGHKPLALRTDSLETNWPTKPPPPCKHFPALVTVNGDAYYNALPTNLPRCQALNHLLGLLLAPRCNQRLHALDAIAGDHNANGSHNAAEMFFAASDPAAQVWMKAGRAMSELLLARWWPLRDVLSFFSAPSPHILRNADPRLETQATYSFEFAVSTARCAALYAMQCTSRTNCPSARLVQEELTQILEVETATHAAQIITTPQYARAYLKNPQDLGKPNMELDFISYPANPLQNPQSASCTALLNQAYVYSRFWLMVATNCDLISHLESPHISGGGTILEACCNAKRRSQGMTEALAQIVPQKVRSQWD